MRLLIAGLGNHGAAEAKYGRVLRGTRHNVGFEMLDGVRRYHGLDWTRQEGHLEAALTLHGLDVRLCAPCATDMNGSGGDLARTYPDPATPVIALTDDLDLPPGTLRCREKGGDGGHRGLRNLHAHYHRVARVRCGIGRGDAGNVLTHVTSPLSPGEHQRIRAMIPDVASLLGQAVLIAAGRNANL